MGCILLVLGLCLLPSIQGFCFSSFGRVDVTATGRKVPICEYNGIDFLDGSKFTTTGCNECECKKGHLHCCGIGVKAGNLTPRPNCKIINDGCVAKEVRISDENLDCVTGKPIRSSSEKVTFPTDAPAAVSLPSPSPTTVDTRGGVAIRQIGTSSSGTGHHGSTGTGTLDNILNKIANNAQHGKQTTIADIMREMSNANASPSISSTSNALYPQFPLYPSTRQGSSSSSSSFQLFDPFTNNDPWSSWVMYNGLMDGSF